MPLLTDRIVITATGMISALGTGYDAHMRHLRRGTTTMRHPQVLRTRHAQEFIVGEVPEPDAALARRLSLHDDQLEKQLSPGQAIPVYTRTALLSMCAVQDLLRHAELPMLQAAGGRLAFINANTVGGMREVEDLYLSFIAPDDGALHTEWIDMLDCAESTEHLARRFGLQPALATISTACSSSANAILTAARMLRLGLADVALAGGGDALSRFTLNGFHSLKNVDSRPCRPFDADRNGLNLGEGAGYLMLEREGDATARGATILAVLAGWCNANDAYHPTAPSPDGSGALRTMQGALRMAGLQPGDIDYINAHGTATHSNDSAEAKAIAALWNGTPPPFSSTKPFTGHTLAAAGAVEAILSIWSMQAGIIPPNLNWETPMDEVAVRPSAGDACVKIRHVMSNSFGFGGNNVSLIFSRP